MSWHGSSFLPTSSPVDASGSCTLLPVESFKKSEDRFLGVDIEREIQEVAELSSVWSEDLCQSSKKDLSTLLL